MYNIAKGYINFSKIEVSSVQFIMFTYFLDKYSQITITDGKEKKQKNIENMTH